MPIMPTSSKEKLMVKVLAGVVGLLVLILAARAVMGGGTGDANTAAPAAPVTQGNTNPGALSPQQHPKVKQLHFTGVDPFSPIPGLLPSPSPVEAAPAPIPTTPSASPPGGSSSIVVSGQTLTLLSVSSENGKDQAQVDVGGVKYLVEPGDKFATD